MQVAKLNKPADIAVLAAIAALASRPAWSIPKGLGTSGQQTATALKLAPLRSLFGRDRDRSRDPADDCFECRVIGTTTCVGVAAYCLHAARTTPAQRVWLTCFGGAWAVLGAIRAVV